MSAAALLDDQSLLVCKCNWRQLKCDGVSALALKLPDHPSLTKLILVGVACHDDGASALAEGLRNARVKSLDISYNFFSDVGVKAFADMLRGNTSALTSLDLSGNRASDDGIVAIAEGVSRNTTLQSLALNRNNAQGDGIGLRGVGALSSMLSSTNSASVLKELHLWGSNIDNDGAALLAKGIIENASLETLDIGWNVVGDAGCFAISEALRRNEALLRIDLRNNKVTLNGVEHFIRVLELVDATLTEVIVGNTTITDINLGGNDLSLQAAAAAAGHHLGSGSEEDDGTTDDAEDDEGDNADVDHDQRAQPQSPRTATTTTSTTTATATATATRVGGLVAASMPTPSSSSSSRLPSPLRRRWRDARAVTDRLLELLSEPARRERWVAARAMRTQKRRDAEGGRAAAAAAADQRRASEEAWWANRARLQAEQLEARKRTEASRTWNHVSDDRALWKSTRKARGPGAWASFGESKSGN